MQTIRYPRHFGTLIPAAIVLWAVMRADDALPAGEARFFLFFGSMGALHATSLVLSLRDRIAVTPAKAVIFVMLVAALSVLTVFSPLLLVPLFPLLSGIGETARLVAALVVASALGASGYWFLLRSFWLKSRSFLNLITTVVLCSAATVTSWLLAGKLMLSTRDIADLIPTLGWWAAFSFSLYCGDVKWGR